MADYSQSPGRCRAPAPRPRKGGYGDAGTLGTNGELPVAAAVAVASEYVLADEMSGAASSLTPETEWSQRVMALLRLEGLVLGGAAADYPSAFADLLLQLRTPLAEQLQERRSAVSRQACHLVSVLVEACGTRFEGMATALMLALFKAQAMSIQVVTEAADACAHALVLHCPTGRMLPHLCTTVLQDKNVKLRQAAAEYLLRAVQEWDCSLYAKQATTVEQAILAAAQDASASTRTAGRSMFVAYFRACPEAAKALVKRVPEKERALKEKLLQAVSQEVGAGAMNGNSLAVKYPRRAYFGGASSSAAPSPRVALSRSSSTMPAAMLTVHALPIPRPSSSPSKPPPPSGSNSGRDTSTASTPVLPRRPASAGPSLASRVDQGRGELAAKPASIGLATPGRTLSRPMECNADRKNSDGERPVVRRPAGGGAIRVALPVDRERPNGSPDTASKLRAPSSAVRVPRPQPGLLAESTAAPLLPSLCSNRGWASDRTPRRPAHRAAVGDSQQWATGLAGFMQDEEPALVPLAEAIAALKKPGAKWSARVELYEGLQATAQAGGEQAEHEAAEHAEQLVGVLLDGAGDAHFKVATAALQALFELMSNPTMGRSLGPYMESIMPALFARVADGKEHIRQLVGSTLAVLPGQHPPDVLLGGMARALQVNKPPRVKCAVMDFYSDIASSSDPQSAALSHPRPLGVSRRSLVAGCLMLATDKNPDIRRSAQQAVAAAYASDAFTVATAISALPPSPQAVVSRSLAQHIASLAADLVVVRANEEQLPAPPKAVAAASPAIQRALQLPAADALLIDDPTPASFSFSCPSPRSVNILNSRPESPKGQLLPSTAPEPSSPFAYSAAIHLAAASGPHGGGGKAGNSVTVSVDATMVGVAGAKSPIDPGTSAQLEALMQQLRIEPTAETMHGMAQLAPMLRGPEWQVHCAEVVEVFSNALAAGSSTRLKKSALQAVSALGLEASRELVAGLVAPLLRSTTDENAEVMASAKTAVQQLFGMLDPCAAVSLLVEHLPAANAWPPFDGPAAAMLLTALKLLHPAITRTAATHLAAALPEVLPPLCTCCNSASADIRRVTVDCVVATWLLVGEDSVGPHLTALSAAQSKLLAIYLERERAKAALPTA